MFFRNICPGLIYLLCAVLASPVMAEKIGHVDTKFKWLGPDDRIVIEAFDDEKVPGVTCYLSRAKTGGLSGAVGIAEDTSDASIACRQTGPISVSDDRRTSRAGIGSTRCYMPLAGGRARR